MKKIQIELTTKEIYLLWTIACWFGKPNWHITGSLMGKLYDAVGNDREKLNKKYEDTELKRIVELGQWIADFHPEWIK